MEVVYSTATGLAVTMFAAQGTEIRAEGEHHVPAEGGALLALNHLSYFDFLYAGRVVLRRGRHVRYLTKVEMFQNPVTRFLLTAMKHIPVDRTAGAEAYAVALAALRAGEVVAVFPEGTTSRSMELTTFKSGAARLAMEAGVPLIPVVLWGSQRVMGKGVRRNLGRRHIPVHVQVGQPLEITNGEDARAVTDRLKTRMGEMLRGLQDRYPPLTGSDLVYVPARLGGTAPTLEEAQELEKSEAIARRARRAARSRR